MSSNVSAGADLAAIFSDLKHKVEVLYKVSLANLAVQVSAKAPDGRECWVAATNGDVIILAPNLLDERLLRATLAHELMHVVQKKLSIGLPESDLCASDALYESEAEAGACDVLQHKLSTRLTPDPSRKFRHFDEDGHYYTTYLAASLAGVNAGLAAKLAFYSQVADLVWELDAISVAIYFGMSDAKMVMNPIAALKQDKIPKHRNYYKPSYLKRFLRLPDYSVNAQRLIGEFPLGFCLAIQKGLHTLTGNPALGEQESRWNRVLKFKVLGRNDMELGLAIHALGDSYAHVNKGSSKMYGPIIGHLLDQHIPDDISQNTVGYVTFAKKLVEFFVIANSAKMPANELLNNMLSRVIILGEKDERVEQLIDLIRFQTKTMPTLYRPPSEAEFWHVFKKRKHAGISLSTHDLDKAIGCAIAWRDSRA